MLLFWLTIYAIISPFATALFNLVTLTINIVCPTQRCNLYIYKYFKSSILIYASEVSWGIYDPGIVKKTNFDFNLYEVIFQVLKSHVLMESEKKVLLWSERPANTINIILSFEL